MGFVRHQYSDYTRDSMTAAGTWLVMVNLRMIEPPGKLQSTMKSLKMHFITDIASYDVTNRLRLGGLYSLGLPGPVPLNIVNGALYRINQGVGLHLAVIGHPPAAVLPPRHTRRNAASLNPANWLR